MRASQSHVAGRSGSILIVVLWACLGLVAITLTFGHSMLMTYRGTDNDLAGRQADQAIEGAARYAQTPLSNGRPMYQKVASPTGTASRS